MTKEEAKEIVKTMMTGKKELNIVSIKKFALYDSTKYKSVTLNQAVNHGKLEQYSK
jgi:hypothetical protein